MATTHTISRRKPATYGKASRKPLCRKPNAFPHDHPLTIVQNSASQNEATLPKPRDIDSIVPSCDWEYSAQRANPAPEPKEPQFGSTYLSNQLYDGLRGRVARVPSAGSISSKDDVETNGPPAFTRTRKKRRVAPSYLSASAEERIPQQVFFADDGGSVSPIAASKDCSGSMEYLLKSPKRNLLEATTENILGDSNNWRFQSNNQCSPPNSQSVLRKEPLQQPKSRSRDSATLVLVREADEERSRYGRSRVAASPICGEHGSGQSLSPLGPRTSTLDTRFLEATSPHQKELWSMLLPKNIRDADSTYVDPFQPRARRRSLVNHYHRTSGRRLRLIDQLQPAKLQRPDSPDLLCYSEVLSGSEDASPVIADRMTPSMIEREAQPLNTERLELSVTHDTLSSKARQHFVLSDDGLKKTYSSQRSHLSTEGLDGTSSLDLPQTDTMAWDSAFPNGKTQYRAPMVAAGENFSRSGLQASQTGSMRTIHELRESGENVRQSHDLEALFDDIDGSASNPNSLRRLKLCELVRKLQEPAYCRLFLDQKYELRLLTLLAAEDGDPILGTLCASAVLCLIAAPSALQSPFPSNAPRIIGLFASRLKDDQDLLSFAKARKTKISKKGLSDLEESIDLLLNSNIWRGRSPTLLSGRIIGLQGLDYLVSRGREPDCETEVLPPTIAEQLIDVLSLPNEASLSLPDPNKLLETQLIVSILASCTINGSNNLNNSWTAVTLAPVLAVLGWLSQMPLEESEETRRLVLRLYLNLTNNNPRLCQEFAGSEVVGSILDIIKLRFQLLSDPGQRTSGTNVLDSLILGLGTLINLVEWSSTVRHIMTIDKIGGESCLETLIKIFLARQKAAAEVKFP
ncbi:MAG: hypothetical protein Q9219_006224 [cf. Caloplaca sp. 3 TL-2023]